MSHTAFRLSSYLTLLLLTSCNYNQFADNEPVAEPIIVNCKFDELPLDVVIDYDAVAQGVVVSSDSTGNFYREIIIQQPASDLNIALQLNMYDIFSVWRVGMMVGIEFKDLTLSMVNGRLTAGILGAEGSISPIPSFAAGLERIHYQGFYGKPLVLERTVDDIEDVDVGKLVVLRDVYFPNQGTIFSGSQRIGQVGCRGTMTLYTSPYASFANDIVPVSTLDMVAFVVLNESDTPILKTSGQRSECSQNGCFAFSLRSE